MSGKDGRELFIPNAKIEITSFPSEIKDLKAELLALKNRVSELEAKFQSLMGSQSLLEAKTQLISIDEEKGILKIGKRTYCFNPRPVQT